MASFGEELRRQRELRSVSLREISDATKINIRFLEALEENDFKHLPGGQFNKGFIRAYARHIGVDGEDMVNAYILEVRRQEEEAPAGRTSAARQRLDPADRRALIALGVLAAIVVLIGVGIWYVFFHRRAKDATPQTARAAHGQRNPGEHHGETPGSPNPAESPASSASPAPTGAEGSSGTAGSPAPAAPAASAAPPEAAQPISPPQTAPTPPAPIDIRGSRAAAAGSGVEMTLRVVPLQTVRFGLLCDGKEAFTGTLEPGRAQSFTCAGVYEISVEDAGGVNLSIDGERIYVGRRGQSIAGRHVSRANLPDFLNPPYEPAGR